MNGKETKYYKYETSGSGFITIPVAIADALNWKHKDKIHITFEIKNGKKGAFLYKKEGKKKGK